MHRLAGGRPRVSRTGAPTLADLLRRDVAQVRAILQNIGVFAVNRTDETQQRIMKAVDHWADINGLNDDEAAAKIAMDGIDILIDLNGYTKDARTKVFARRPTPIAVNWFGYPGTMGTPYHHYLIADPYIVPPDLENYYSERILRLPCYQPNDRKRIVAERRPTRFPEHRRSRS